MTMDNDDVFQYLGGLSLAVKSVSGAYPDVLVSRQADMDNIYIEDIEKTIGMELRSRYLNPEWIKGMKKENYAGAREMEDFVENMWGWQTTTPFAVDAAKWEQVYEVYIKDKYDLDLKDFFNKNNPWAYQSISARMLEADRKKYWKAPEGMKKKLAKTYALNVIEKGVACCEHTCNNPMLQQFVTYIFFRFHPINNSAKRPTAITITIHSEPEAVTFVSSGFSSTISKPSIFFPSVLAFTLSSF